MPELIVFPMPPLEFAFDATPAVQTEHCAADHNGTSTITKEKSILLMFFMIQIYKKMKYGPLTPPKGDLRILPKQYIKNILQSCILKIPLRGT
jgi:hypothetical protein